ncbi:hypothetical protein QTP88_014537 [Uroleucon formosanum]
MFTQTSITFDEIIYNLYAKTLNCFVINYIIRDSADCLQRTANRILVISYFNRLHSGENTLCQSFHALTYRTGLLLKYFVRPIRSFFKKINKNIFAFRCRPQIDYKRQTKFNLISQNDVPFSHLGRKIPIDLSIYIYPSIYLKNEAINHKKYQSFFFNTTKCQHRWEKFSYIENLIKKKNVSNTLRRNTILFLTEVSTSVKLTVKQ